MPVVVFDHHLKDFDEWFALFSANPPPAIGRWLLARGVDDPNRVRVQCRHGINLAGVSGHHQQDRPGAFHGLGDVGRHMGDTREVVLNVPQASDLAQRLLPTELRPLYNLQPTFLVSSRISGFGPEPTSAFEPLMSAFRPKPT